MPFIATSFRQNEKLLLFILLLTRRNKNELTIPLCSTNNTIALFKTL